MVDNKSKIIKEVLDRFAKHQTAFKNWQEWKLYADRLDDRPHGMKYSDRIVWIINETIKVMEDAKK